MTTKELSKTVGSFLLLAVLAAASAFGQEAKADAKDAAKKDAKKDVEKSEMADNGASGVTFDNKSRATVYLLATYGDKQCGEMPERTQAALAANESLLVESGDSLVCWCTGTSGKVGDCGEWQKAKAGKRVILR
jgi:hypothetical protein